MAVIIANASIMPVFWLGSEKRFFVFIIFIVFIFFDDGCVLSDVFFAAAVMIGGLRVVARNDGTLSVMVGCCPTFFLRR